MSDPLAKLLGLDGPGRPGDDYRPAPPLRPGSVTKVDPATGSVWVTPDDGDARTPLGPCLGATEEPVLLATLAATTTTYRLAFQPLPVGRRVLVVATSTGTWVAAVDHSPT